MPNQEKDDIYIPKKPAAKPKVYTVIKPPKGFNIPKPAASNRFSRPAPIFEERQPFWKSEGFKSFITKLTAPKPIAGTGRPVAKIGGTMRVSDPPTVRPLGYRPPIESIEDYKVGLAKVQIYKNEPPDTIFYQSDKSAKPTQDKSIFLTQTGETPKQGTYLAPFTASDTRPEERLALVNQGRAMGWSDSHINFALGFYDHFGNPENIPLIRWMGQIPKEWAANTSNQTPVGAVLNAVKESLISTYEYAGTNFGVRTPWRVNPDTKKFEFRNPIRIGDANSLLEKRKEILARQDPASGQIPYPEEEAKRRLADLDEWFPEAKKDYQHVLESRSLMEDAWANVGIVMGEAARMNPDYDVSNFRESLALVGSVKYWTTNIGELSPSELIQRNKEMQASAIEATKLKAKLDSGVNYIDPAPVTIARIEAERAIRLASDSGSLDYATIEKELRAADVKRAQETAQPLSIEESQSIWEGAIAAKTKEQAIRYSDTDLAFTAEGNPYFQATWTREPWRQEAYLRGLAEFELQAGRPPTTNEMNRIASRYVNPGTEMAAEFVVDATNILDAGVLVNVFPVLKPALKWFDEAFKIPLKLQGSKFIQGIPFIGRIFREANVSVANKWTGLINDALNKVHPEFISKLAPEIAPRLKMALNLPESGVRQIWMEMTDPTNVKYIPGSQNISFAEFYNMRELANPLGGGIDPAKWDELYKKSLEDAQNQIEYKIRHSITAANPKKSELEVNKLIKDSMDKTINSKQHYDLANEYFSKNFGNSFLDGHRITIDASGRRSALLDDTFTGQIVQKLRMLGDQTELFNMPRVRKLYDNVELDIDTRAVRKLDLPKAEKAKIWQDLHGAVKMRTLSLGDHVDKMILEAGTVWGAGARKAATGAANVLEGISWVGSQMYQAWAMAVLSLNPRWYIQNLVDSTSRTIPFGGNPLEDIFMLMAGTHKNLADPLGGIPIALGTSLSRNGIDTAYGIAYRYLSEGWKPTYGPFSFFKYEYDRILREGVVNLDEAPPLVAKILSAKTPTTKVGAAMRRLIGGINNVAMAIPGASSDFNTAIEFTVRLRMFSREYFKLLDEFDGVFKTMDTEALSPTVKALTERIWKAADSNPTKLTALVDDIVKSLTEEGGRKLTQQERVAKSWSMLFNDDVDKALKDFTPGERATFLADISDRFNAVRSAKLANGSDMTSDDVIKLHDEYLKGMQDEIQARMSQTNSTLRKMNDGIGAPDRLPDAPSVDDIVSHDGTPIKPIPPREVKAPTRKTPNTSIRQMMDDIQNLFKPSASGEAKKGAKDLRYTKGRTAVESFGKAMSEYGKVSVVPGGELSVFFKDGEIVINIGEEVIGKSQSDMVNTLNEALIRTVGLRDFDVFSHRMDLETYVKNFKEFIIDAGSVAERDPLSFYTMGSQLVQDPHLRKILENLNGRPLNIESTSRMTKKAGVSLSDVMSSDWRNQADELNDINNRAPEHVRRAASIKANTSTDLWQRLDKVDPLVREDLAFFMHSTSGLDNQLWNYMVEYYPGPRKSKGKFIRLNWDKYWNMKAETFDAATTRNRFLIDLLDNSPMEAKAFLNDFNTNIQKNYLESVGFKNLKFNMDGTVDTFDIAMGGKMVTINKSLATDALSNYFFGDISKLTYSRNKTTVIDATKLNVPGWDAFTQIKEGFIKSFGLTDNQAEQFAKVTYKRTQELSARGGEPIETILAEHLGFKKIDGKLDAGSGVSLAKSKVKDGTGRFTFYGYGDRNFNGVVSQMAQMHYQDLVYLAARGDAQAVADLRAINKLVERLDFDVDAIKGFKVADGKTVGSLLSDEQAKIVSDLYAEWVKTGVTEQKGLKTAFQHMSEIIGDSYQNLAKNVDVLNEGVDADTFNLLDRAFHSIPQDSPKSNSFLIRNMAKKNGLPTKASDLLNVINNHPSVLGSTREHYDVMVKSFMDAGYDKQTSEMFYDLLRFNSMSMSPKGDPEAWMRSFEFVKGEDIDFLALAKATDGNPLFSLGMDNSQLDEMVESIFRSTSNKTERATNLRTLLTDASPQERLHLLVKIGDKDEPLAKEMAAYLTKNKMMFQKSARLPSTEVPEFKSWFKNSKVVNSDGSPMVVYHGTTRDFSEFSPSAPKSTDDGWFGKGFYFTPNTSNANIYSMKIEEGGIVEGSKVMPLFVSVENPFYFKKEQDAFLDSLKQLTAFKEGDIVRNVDTGEVIKLGTDEVINKGDFVWISNESPKSVFESLPTVTRENSEELTNRIKALGHDGVFVTDTANEIKEIVAFEPTQVKSIYNNGAFDPTNPNMLKQSVGEVTKGAYWMENGKRYVALFQKADVTTLAHEVFHANIDEMIELDDWRLREIERYTGVAKGEFTELRKAFKEYPGIREWAKNAKPEGEMTAEVIAQVEQTMKVKYDRYVAAHEKASNAGVHYIYTQEAPTPELKRVFEWFKQKLSSLWDSVKGTMPDLDEGMIKVFDSLFTPPANKIKILRRYSSLGDVPLEVAEKVFGETAATRFSRELDEAFGAWKLGQLSMKGIPPEATESYSIFKQFLASRIDDTSGEIEEEFRLLQWQLEQFTNKVGQHHFGDELLETLAPTIPDTHIGAGVKSAIKHNADNMRIFNGMFEALNIMEKDWLARINGGEAITPLLSKMEADNLQAWATKAARNKADMVNMIVNGGQVKNALGKVVASSDGALPRTNKVLLDYSTRSNLDMFMKNFFPFWMFPSRTLPFWAETLATHPSITSLYFKIKRASETQRYQAGAIDSQGRPMTSLNGYVKMPGTDLWFNPLAPFSFRYLLDLYKFVDNAQYNTPESEETLTGLPYVVKEFMQNAPLIGFNVSPWTGYVLKKSLGIPDGIMPGWSIMPQFNLIPKWQVMPFIEGLNNSGNGVSRWAGDLATYWMFPEPNWQDTLIEKRILENVSEYANANPNMSQAEWNKTRDAAYKAIANKGNDPLWLSTYKEVTQEDATRNFAAFFTGVYAKTFTDGQADLIQIKLQNKAMSEAMNNAATAAALGLPTEDQARWDVRSELKNADTPDAWLARIYSDIGWVKNDKGQVVNEPKERAKLLAIQMEKTELSRQIYFDFKKIAAERDAELMQLPVGAPKEMTDPIWKDYYAKKAELEKLSPDYTYLGSSKPVSLIEEEIRYNWWNTVKLSMPVKKDDESPKEYSNRYDQWLIDLPNISRVVIQSFTGTYNDKVSSLKPDQLKLFNQKLLDELVKETTVEGYAEFRRLNDTVWDAANEAYRINRWDKYWDSVDGKEGTARDYAEWQFAVNNPDPGANQIYQWAREIYGDRFSVQDFQKLMGKEKALSIEDRMNTNRSEEEKYKDTIWMLLSWAGGSTGKGALDKAYQMAGGESGDIDTFYDTSGYGYDHSPAKLKQMAMYMEQAAVNIKLGQPAGAEYRQRLEAEDLNFKFKLEVERELGKEFLQQGDPESGIPNGIYPRYLGLDYDIQALYKKDHPEDYKKIQQYQAKRKTYARENPLWAQYYFDYVKVKNMGLPVVKPVKPVASPYSSGGSYTPPTRPNQQQMEGNLPSDNTVGSSYVPSREVSNLSLIQWPEGFRKAVGNSLANEIESLIKQGRWLSPPAKTFLYDMAKRHRKWRGFIYQILSK